MEHLKKINILFMIDVLWGGGGTEHHLYYLSKYLNKERFNCAIVVFDLKEMLVKKIREENIKVYHIPVGRPYTPKALAKIFELKKIIKENNIDIVQTFHFTSDTYGTFASRLSGIRHIISSRRDIGDTKKKRHIFLNKIMNPYINRFITVCNAVGERIEKDEGIPRKKQITIYNGVDTNKYVIPDREVILKLRDKFKIAKKDFVVGMVANFRPEKNHDIFLKAIKKVKESVDNLKVLLIGGGGYTLIWCQEYCKKNNMDNYVTFTKGIADVREYISAMDVACLVPGTNEGFSNAILEKMAMGKPLIVTNVGGNSEAVEHGVNGIVIPPLDSDALAEAIIYLNKNPEIRGQMGKKSRERVKRLFSMEKMIKEHEKLYEEVFNGK